MCTWVCPGQTIGSIGWELARPHAGIPRSSARPSLAETLSLQPPVCALSWNRLQSWDMHEGVMHCSRLMPQHKMDFSNRKGTASPLIYQIC
jgi:hypothetical protein